nr:hypothetical protein [Tanacetum cinerariifolium]
MRPKMVAGGEEVDSYLQGEVKKKMDLVEMNSHKQLMCIARASMPRANECWCMLFNYSSLRWIRVKEVSGWVPGFLEEDDEVDASEDDTSDNEYGGHMKVADFQVDDDVNKVPETIFDKTEASKEGNVKELEEGEINSEDP